MGQLFLGMTILLVLNENRKFRFVYLLLLSLVLQLQPFKEQIAMLEMIKLAAILNSKLL